MRGRGAHKKTNPTGGKGKGRGGRKTFIDNILWKFVSSQRLSSRRPKPQHSPQSNYETEEIVSPKHVEEPAENVEEPAENVEEPVESIEDPVESIEELVENFEEPTKNIEEPV